MNGIEALRAGAAFVDVSARGRLKLTGEDRKRLLHALTTNHIEEMSPGQARQTYFLNAQGRILGTADVLCTEDALLLSVEPETREKLFAHIDRYIIADDVTIEDVTEATAEFFVSGAAAAEGLRVELSLTGAAGYRVIVPLEQRGTLVEELKAAGLAEASDEELRRVQIENGVARYGEDITEANLVQETARMGGVHANKGCYLGQEIVERVRSRGHVNRLLVRLELDSEVAAGTVVLAGEAETGVVTSSAGGRALAYVKAPHAKAGTAVSAGGVSGQVLG